jgi:hypothetical protein
MATNASQTPVPAATTDGAPLPLVALPQPELLTVNQKELPVLQNILGPGIHAVNLMLDIEHGEAVAILRLEPGAELPIHPHTGPAEVYTIRGRWIYKEYPNQPQTRCAAPFPDTSDRLTARSGSGRRASGLT